MDIFEETTQLVCGCSKNHMWHTPVEFERHKQGTCHVLYETRRVLAMTSQKCRALELQNIQFQHERDMWKKMYRVSEELSEEVWSAHDVESSVITPQPGTQP